MSCEAPDDEEEEDDEEEDDEDDEDELGSVDGEDWELPMWIIPCSSSSIASLSCCMDSFGCREMAAPMI